MRIAVLILVAVLAAGCAPEEQPSGGIPLVIEPGLAPRLTPEEVASIVRRQNEGSEAIVGMLAPLRIQRVTVTTANRVGSIEAAAGGDGMDGALVVWVVRAQGTFTTRRGLGARPPTATSGYYVIDDGDGSILSYGFP